MSSKPKKNKAPKAEKPVEKEEIAEVSEEQFVDDAVELETVPQTEEKQKGAPKKASSDSKKKSRKGFKLSSVDPIILASFTVFLVACLIVSGVTIYNSVAGEKSDKVAEYGSDVEVNYTGSYFAYYDEEGAVIFDTNVEDVGDDDSYVKSYEYTAKDSYSPLSLKAGQGNYLDDFKNAIIGHKAGDVIKVKVSEGYGSLTDDVNKFTVGKTGVTVEKFVDGMTTGDYKALFGVDAPETGMTQYDVHSPYGWGATVTNTNSVISIEYTPTAGETYTSGGVTIKVNTVNATTINVDYQVDSFDYNTKILKTAYDGKIVYVIGADATNMTYKTTNERTGIDLYFVIELVSVS